MLSTSSNDQSKCTKHDLVKVLFGDKALQSSTVLPVQAGQEALLTLVEISSALAAHDRREIRATV